MRKVSFPVFVLATIWSMSALAAPPLLPVQGRLVDSGGQPVNDAQIVVFRVYDVPVGGTHVFEETQLIEFSDGYFVTYMGEDEPLPLTMFDGAPELWLGVKVGDDAEMTPRLRLGAAPSAPFANTCGDADTLGALGADDFARTSHPHSGYAATSHPHSDYSTTGHGHTGYAATSHPHSDYAPVVHPHPSLADAVHLHAGNTITDGSIDAVDLAANAVTASKIATGGVGTSEIADQSVGSVDLNLSVVSYPQVIAGQGNPDTVCSPVRTANFCALTYFTGYGVPGVDDGFLRNTCHITLLSAGQWQVCAEKKNNAVTACVMTCF